MTNNELIVMLSSRMEEAIANAGWDFIVLQKEQPTQEGLPGEEEGDAVYFELTLDDPVGWPIRVQKNLYPQNFFAEIETQLTATTFQISAMIKQDVTDTTKPTAEDVVSYVHRFLSHKASVRLFMLQKANVLRVSSVRNGYFVQDTMNFEAHPNFDFVITHSKDMSINVNAADRAVPELIARI